jgi:hypothetical protein
MKSAGALSTMLLVTSLVFSGGSKNGASCGRAIEPLGPRARATVPATRAPDATAVDAAAIADQFTVLAFI